VKSATHKRFGAFAANQRFTRSGAGVAAGLGTVVHRVLPRTALVSARTVAGTVIVGSGLSAVDTEHSNVCYYSGVVWTSRLGHIYHVRTPPIIEPLLDPIPGPGPEPPLFIQPDDDWGESSIWDDTPPETDTEPSPRPPPAIDPDNEPPPF
jgi:hypothetical protein